MGKIICDVCGTSYSEGASQCPICGCARSADNHYDSVDVDSTPVQTQYKHVKGGRFSKSNVKKRNKNIQQKTEQSAAVPADAENTEKSNKGLVITIFVLLLAIFAVIAYIAFNFVIPVMFPKTDKLDSEISPVTEPSVMEVLENPCSELVLEFEEIALLEGEEAQLNVDILPEDTTDTISYTVDDESIAYVDDNGMITAVSKGETVVKVVCGSVEAHCTIIVEAIELVFEYTEVNFDQLGSEISIYTGSIPVEDIVWYSDDDTVATISNGVITAVGDGTTTVYGQYGDIVAGCTVFCETTEAESETEATDAVITDNGPYRLDNPYGVSDTDASIFVGGSFTLYLVDKDENRVTGVEWSIESGSSCTVEDGLIKGIAAGQSTVVATYGGESYSCIVRVS